MKNILEDTLERTAKIISHRAGVKIVYKGNQTPSTDGTSIQLPAVPTPLTEEVEIAFKAYTDHECAHCLYSSFEIGKKFAERYGVQGFMLLNSLCDLRVEAWMERDYPGCKVNFERAYEVESKQWKEIIPQTHFGYRLMACIIAVGKGWDTDLYGPDVQPYIQPIVHLIPKVLDMPNTFAVARVAVRIIKIWKRINDEHLKQGEYEPKNVNRERLDTEGLNDLPTGNPFGHGKFLQDAIGHAMEQSATMPYRVYDRSEDVVENAPDVGADAYMKILAEARPLVAGLRQRLIMTLKGEQQKRLVSSENGTVLNRKHLHTLCLEVPGNPLASKVKSPSKDVAISCLVDMSGSMRSEGRMDLARGCAVLLSETMQQLGFPLEVIGFTTRYDKSHLCELRKNVNEPIEHIEAQYARFVPTLHWIFKGFGESLQKCRGRFGSMRATHYTPLNESILLAGKRLLSVAASRRLLIVLTDGACYYGSKSTQGIAQRNLQENLELLNKTGIEVIAVGLKAKYVLDVFPKAICVDDIRQLPHEFYRIISKTILERK